MIDYSNYKQSLWAEYNDIFNKYSKWNDSFSVNARLIYMDIDNSNWDTVGGSVDYWNKGLSQLSWKIYENVPLFQNAPAVTQQSSGSETTETKQSFTATLKFIVTPKPNDLLMYYNDSSNTVYRITSVRFSRTAEGPLQIFECDFESAPILLSTLYENLNVTSHELLNEYNHKLYDFETWVTDYEPILENATQIVRDTNSYFDEKLERYNVQEFNPLIKDLLINSKLKSVTDFKAPFADCDDSCVSKDSSDTLADLYDKLNKLKEITC